MGLREAKLYKVQVTGFKVQKKIAPGQSQPEDKTSQTQMAEAGNVNYNDK